jgi:hypothetical protein
MNSMTTLNEYRLKDVNKFGVGVAQGCDDGIVSTLFAALPGSRNETFVISVAHVESR